MWRDPLDELIEDLEGALPPSPKPSRDEDLPRLFDVQRAVQAVLAHGRGERADPSHEPWFQKVKEQLACRVERSKFRTAPVPPLDVGRNVNH